MHLGMSGSFRVNAVAISNARPARSRHLRHVQRRGDHVQRSAAFRFHGPADAASTGHPRRVERARSGAPVRRIYGRVTGRARSRGRKPRSRPRSSISAPSPGWGTFTRSRRSIAPACRPLRQASTIATPAGRARPAAERLSAAIKEVLQEAVARKRGRRYRGHRFRVYDREGERCLTSGCRGSVERRTQTGRSTFYCPACQR